MKNTKINDYICKEEASELDLEFEKFFKNKSALKKAERKININRFSQSFKVIFSNFFILPFVF